MDEQIKELIQMHRAEPDNPEVAAKLIYYLQRTQGQARECPEAKECEPCPAPPPCPTITCPPQRECPIVPPALCKPCPAPKVCPAPPPCPTTPSSIGAFVRANPVGAAAVVGVGFGLGWLLMSGVKGA